MPIYKAPLRDIHFSVFEMNNFSRLQQFQCYAEFSSDLITTVFGEAAKFCENELFPLNQSGDAAGCTYHDGQVTTPPGFKAAYQKFVDNGWGSLSCDPQYGGQGLPETVSIMLQEITSSANLSFGLYPGLTKGAYSALHRHGSEALKNKYLAKLAQGSWIGTMNLTEAHCGTDLGLLKTKAVKQSDDSYKISGTKIFISSGENDLTDNIIHLVLARTPDAPHGTKGISLFLVPKFMVNDDGTLGARNGVRCASIEHKHGIRASATCVMNYDAATGYLIGDLNKGLHYMFTMMNIERIGVGMQGLGIAEVSYQNALNYARERLQGRSLTGVKKPDKPADPLIVHGDIRRMLLTMKAYTEGNRMLAAWIANQVDIANNSPQESERQAADDFIQLMTPIVKAFFTDIGTLCAHHAIQIHGGFGYICDYGIEQFVRDARICQIYEGTNGIQALDLVGRKLSYHMGHYLKQFFHPVQSFLDHHYNNHEWNEFTQPLGKAFERLQKACMTIAARALSNPDEAGTAADDFLNLFAHVTLGYLWTQAAMIAKSRIGENDPDGFYQSKYQTAQFYVQKLLPKTGSYYASIMAGGSSIMQIKDQCFGPFD